MRIIDFREVDLGYGEADARSEAARCLAGRIDGCIECGECAGRCDVKAIDYAMKDEVEERHFDSIVLAPGFDLYDPTEKGEFGYGRLEGVCTGIEFERILFRDGSHGWGDRVEGEKAEALLFHTVRRLPGQAERGAFLLEGMLHVHGETREHREG